MGYSPYLTFLNGAVFVVLLAWALVALRQLIVGENRPIHFVIIVHFVFCGVPPLLDVLFGQPEYLSQPGLFNATRDVTTTLIYALYVCFCPLVWFFTFRRVQSRPRSGGQSTSIVLRDRVRLCYAALMLAPLVMTVLSPDRQRYLHYGMKAFVNESGAGWQNLILLFCSISVIATAGFLLGSRRLSPAVLMFSGFALFMACWLHGKRSIVAIAALMIGYVLWERGILRGGKLVAAGATAAIAFAIFSTSYQTSLHGGRYAVITYGLYENIRVDYGRDDVIKMTLHAELNPAERQILEYRGQSLLFYATIWFPRSAWPDKPWPYAVYFTSAMLNFPTTRILNWGMTTSWLEEAIANFGWWGLLIGPFSLALFCHLGWTRGDPLTVFLTLLIVCLLITVHLSAFFVLFSLWILRLLTTQRLPVG